MGSTILTCGVHFGDTKDPASMVFNPVCANLLTSSILVATGMLCFSFCSPSRGPTSTIRTKSDDAVAYVRRSGYRAAKRAVRRQVNFESIFPCSMGFGRDCQGTDCDESGVRRVRLVAGISLRGALASARLLGPIAVLRHASSLNCS